MSVYDNLTFAPMLITDVFESMAAAREWFDLSKAKTEGTPGYPYIARSGGDNGIGAFLPHQGVEPPNAGNAITVGVSTSTVFYQPVAFYTSKEIQVLRHSQLDQYNAMLLVAMLREQMGKFQWGNGASLVRLKATRIMVPVTDDGSGQQDVDWDGMTMLGRELFVEAKASAKRVRCSEVSVVEALPELHFEPMLLPEVFESMAASQAWYDKVHLKEGGGENLYLSQTLSDNGVVDVVAEQSVSPEPGNCITITLKTQSTFYQPAPFYTAQNFLIFRHKYLNSFNGPVLVAILRNGLQKFSWGYGVSMARLNKLHIMVPVTCDADGDQVVDWEGMTAYGLGLRARVEDETASVIDHAA